MLTLALVLLSAPISLAHAAGAGAQVRLRAVVDPIRPAVMHVAASAPRDARRAVFSVDGVLRRVDRAPAWSFGRVLAGSLPAGTHGLGLAVNLRNGAVRHLRRTVRTVSVGTERHFTWDLRNPAGHPPRSSPAAPLGTTMIGPLPVPAVGQSVSGPMVGPLPAPPLPDPEAGSAGEPVPTNEPEPSPASPELGPEAAAPPAPEIQPETPPPPEPQPVPEPQPQPESQPEPQPEPQPSPELETPPELEPPPIPELEPAEPVPAPDPEPEAEPEAEQPMEGPLPEPEQGAPGGEPEPEAETSSPFPPQLPPAHLDAGFENGLHEWNTAGVGDVVPTIVSDLVRSGTQSARVVLEGQQERSELILGGPNIGHLVRFYQGNDFFYGFSFLVLSMTYGRPGAHNLIFQFKSSNEGSPRFGLQLWDYKGHRGLWTHGEAMGGDRFLAPIETGRWYDVAIHFEVSSHDTGFYRVHVNGTLVDAANQVSILREEADFGYIKNGLYRNPETIPGPSEIRLDSAVLGTSLEEVMAR